MTAAPRILFVGDQPAPWCHGHMHESFDHQLGRTRAICNPRGYFPNELNRDFNPALVVELGDGRNK